MMSPVSKSTSEASWAGKSSALMVAASEGLLFTSIGAGASTDSFSKCFTVFSTLRDGASFEKVTVSPPLRCGTLIKWECVVGTTMGALDISGLLLHLPHPLGAFGGSADGVACCEVENFLLPFALRVRDGDLEADLVLENDFDDDDENEK